MTIYLSPAVLHGALTVPDLSVSASEHAIAAMLTTVTDGLGGLWDVPTIEHRPNPLVSVRDNYDRLGFSQHDVTRDSRYSRHVSPTVMLRKGVDDIRLLRSSDPRIDTQIANLLP